MGYHVEVETEITEMQSNRRICLKNKLYLPILRLPIFAKRMSTFTGHGTITGKFMNAKYE
jgi:hypothetical protein